MVNASEASDYTEALEFKDGEVYTIDKPETHKIETFKARDSDDESRKLVIRFVEMSRPTVLNNTSRKKLSEAWGPETNKWAGKKVKASLTTMMISGNKQLVLYLEADSAK